MNDRHLYHAMGNGAGRLSRGHLFVTVCTLYILASTFCVLVARVRIVAQELRFIRLSGGFAKALVHVLYM